MIISKGTAQLLILLYSIPPKAKPFSYQVSAREQKLFCQSAQCDGRYPSPTKLLA